MPLPKTRPDAFTQQRRAKPPKLEFDSVLTRGPRELQRSLISGDQIHNPAPAVPGWWRSRYPRGTIPEWSVYWAHLRLGKLHGTDFRYQAPLIGGRIDLGGMVADFEELSTPGILINIQGEYWHYERGSDQVARDQLQRTDIGSMGYQLIFLDANDALTSPIWFLKEALRGVDHSRGARGSF